MLEENNLSNTQELVKEIKKLKNENEEMKQRIENLEKTIQIIKEDLYIEEIEDDDCNGCSGNCDTCKNE